MSNTDNSKEAVVLDLENLNPGIWFSYRDSDVAKVCLRTCAGDDLREIRKVTVKKKVEYKNGTRFPYEEANEELFRELLWDFTIVDWKGFVDAKGNLIPCTKENKLLLMGKSTAFSDFVTDCLEILKGDAEKEKEEEEKN